ncbi:MAG: 50S ribosomal protein L23, partial [Spirochaetota bacterium]|nr:50S ribosomal protein L23 [Spirochaetota bacterium]
GNKYYFQVHPKANKKMIKNALEKIYKVKVTKCNLLVVKGKKVKTRYGTSYKSNWKKAIVTLKAGDKFDFYEGI